MTPPILPFHRLARALLPGLAIAAAFIAVSARAQSLAAPTDEAVRITAGVGVGSRPSFPGSDRRETRALPLLSLEAGRFFIGPVPGAGGSLGLALGWDLWRAEGLRLGVALGSDLSDPRKESDDARLQGLGNVRKTQRAAVFGGLDAGRWVLRGAVASDIGGEHLGTVATLEGEWRFFPAPRWVWSAGPSLVWQSGEGMQTLWGIDAEQSLRSGRPTYRAAAGLSQVQLQTGLAYVVDERWRLGARAALVRLQGDAADSPLAFDRSQHVFSLFAAYRF